MFVVKDYILEKFVLEKFEEDIRSGYLQQNKSGNFNVILPNCVREIAPYAFAGIDCIDKVELSKNVEVIHEYAFEKCSNLSRLITNDRLRIIKKFAFYSCQISSVDLHACSQIGESAFARNPLKYIILPENTESFEKDIFCDDISCYRKFCCPTYSYSSLVLLNRDCNRDDCLKWFGEKFIVKTPNDVFYVSADEYIVNVFADILLFFPEAYTLEMMNEKINSIEEITEILYMLGDRYSRNICFKKRIQNIFEFIKSGESFFGLNHNYTTNIRQFIEKNI